MFAYLVLTKLFGEVTQFMIFSALTIFLLVTGGFRVFTSDEIGISFEGTQITGIVAFLTSFFIGGLVTSLYIPQCYWRGSDGWENVNLIGRISELSLSPSEAFEFFRTYVVLSNPGFYYYFSAFHLVTGFSVDSIMRYGGMIQSGLFVALAYIFFKRLNGVLPGLAGAFLLALNPFYNHRFMVLLREDFSLLFMFAGLFVYEACRGSSNEISALRILSQASLVSACLVSHPMTPIILFGVLLFQLVSFRIEEKKSIFLQDFMSILLGTLIALPFIKNMIIPILNFISKISYQSSFMVLIPFSILIVVIYFARYLGVHQEKLCSGSLKAIGVFIIIPPILSILLRSSFENTCDYNQIELAHFSQILVPLSIAGYFLFYLEAKNRLIVGLNLVVSMLIVSSFFGIPVPLDRLSVPLSWLMSFYASYLVSEFMQASFKESRPIKQVSKFISRLMDQRMTLVFIFMILAGGVIELSSIRRSKSIFDPSDVMSTSVFVSELEQNELVFPYGISEHVLYYADASRDNIVTDLGVTRELYELLEGDSLYEVSDLIQECYPHVDSLVFYVYSGDEYSLREKPFSRLLDIYFERTLYGDYSSYSLEIHFTIEKLKLDRVKFIEDVHESDVLGSSGDVVAVSNCLVISNSEASHAFMFLRESVDGSNFLGLASSPDGLTWSIEQEEKLSRDLDSLSIVEYGERYYLYAGTNSKDKIVRFESQDLRRWDNYTVVIDCSNSEEWVFMESPIVWPEYGGLGLLWWETAVGDSVMKGVRYASSTDGVDWNTEPEPLGWVLMDPRYRVIKYDRILLCDFVQRDDGVMFFARMHVANATFSMSWITGSISLKEVTSKAAEARYLVFKDHLGSEMNAIHVVQDLGGSNNELIYLEEGGGVFVGTASDHNGLDDRYLSLP
jgi:hypothetical protein